MTREIPPTQLRAIWSAALLVAVADACNARKPRLAADALHWLQTPLARTVLELAGLEADRHLAMVARGEVLDWHAAARRMEADPAVVALRREQARLRMAQSRARRNSE